jgi:hypothetical protein
VAERTLLEALAAVEPLRHHPRIMVSEYVPPGEVFIVDPTYRLPAKRTDETLAAYSQRAADDMHGRVVILAGIKVP